MAPIMHHKTLRIATRKSPLALWQAHHVGELLKRSWPTLSIELVPMLTSGDRFTKDKLQRTGGKGLFVKELEEALLGNRADLAVHSMKDVPAELPEGLCLATICKRDNPFDAFVSERFESLKSLPINSTVGTASLRRQSQLLALRPDLNIITLRGNVNTRLEKLKSGNYDAIILAAAGLERLGLAGQIKEILSLDVMLPACAQGALGIECRLSDAELHELLSPLHDELSAACIYAERHVNARLGGNCHVPLAVYAAPNNEHQLVLKAAVMSLNGRECIKDQQKGVISDALQLADVCADNLLLNGAERLLSSHE